MSLEKLFENIDSTILTQDMKDSLKESFNNAVNERVESIVAEKTDELESKADEYADYLKEEYEGKTQELESKINALDEQANNYADYLKEEYEGKTQELESKINALDEQANNYADYLKEEYEGKIDTLTEKADEYVQLQMDEMNENVSNYIDRTIQDFIVEAKEQMCVNVDNAKAEAITEAFSKFAITAGVEVSDIVEAHDNSMVSTKLNSAIEENDRLVNENLSLVSKIKKLNEKVNTLLKMGVIKEMSDGMTLVESRKFENLANLVEFSNDSKFIDSLQQIAETVRNQNYDDDDYEDDRYDLNENQNDNITLDQQKVDSNFTDDMNERLNRLI